MEASGAAIALGNSQTKQIFTTLPKVWAGQTQITVAAQSLEKRLLGEVKD